MPVTSNTVLGSGIVRAVKGEVTIPWWWGLSHGIPSQSVSSAGVGTMTYWWGAREVQGVAGGVQGRCW